MRVLGGKFNLLGLAQASVKITVIDGLRNRGHEVFADFYNAMAKLAFSVKASFIGFT